jgi:hypothetical protein
VENAIVTGFEIKKKRVPGNIWQNNQIYKFKETQERDGMVILTLKGSEGGVGEAEGGGEEEQVGGRKRRRRKTKKKRKSKRKSKRKRKPKRKTKRKRKRRRTKKR